MPSRNYDRFVHSVTGSMVPMLAKAFKAAIPNAEKTLLAEIKTITTESMTAQLKPLETPTT